MRGRSLSSLREKLQKVLSSPNVSDLLDPLVELLTKLIEEYNRKYGVLTVLVTGSLAKGRFVRGLSDIDILVVTREAPAKEDRFLLDNVRGVDIEITLYSLDELRLSLAQGSYFIRDALESGVVVYGKGISEILGE